MVNSEQTVRLSSYAPGTDGEVNLFLGGLDDHKCLLYKQEEEKIMMGCGLYGTQVEEVERVLSDKDFRGLSEVAQTIDHEKMFSREILSLEGKYTNAEIVSDGVIHES